MRNRSTYPALFAGVALVAIMSIAPVAAASSREEIRVTTSRTAWYAQAPPCATVDCSILPLVHPYPEDSLHVSIAGGRETARTYVAFPLVLPADDRLVGGTLKLPLDQDPSNGNLTPETAELVACLTTAKFKPVRGSYEEPPKANCKVRMAARYDAQEAAFTVDLERFADRWRNDQAALALVPSEAAVMGGQSWHVAFPAGEEEEDAPPEQQGAPAITATLEYLTDSPGATDTTFDVAIDDPSSSSAGGGGVVSSSGPSIDDGTGFTAAQPQTEVPEVTTPAEVTPEQATPATFFVEGFAGPGFAYPIVWALPLLLLLGLGAAGRALTKDLYRRGV